LETKHLPRLSFPLNKPIANRIATGWQLAQMLEYFSPQNAAKEAK